MGDIRVVETTGFNLTHIRSVIGHKYRLKRRMHGYPHIAIGTEFYASHGIIDKEGIYVNVTALGRRQSNHELNNDVLFDDWMDSTDFANYLHPVTN